jgi:hypothetical protein
MPSSGGEYLVLSLDVGKPRFMIVRSVPQIGLVPVDLAQGPDNEISDDDDGEISQRVDFVDQGFEHGVTSQESLGHVRILV